jgi:excisionase family DNA binding protein
MSACSKHARPPPFRNGPERDADLDRGITVTRAAELLGCNPSTVRRLIKVGALSGWRVATHPSRRGDPRVSLSSIQAWRRAHKLEADFAPPSSENQRTEPQHPTLTASHRAAIANLKDLGII